MYKGGPCVCWGAQACYLVAPAPVGPGTPNGGTMTRIGRTALAALAAITTVPVAKAQLPGIPYYPVNTGLGINVAADYGKPTGAGTAGHGWGLTGGLGLSSFGLSASFGGSDAGAGSQTTFAGAVGMKLFGGGLTPVQIGA